MSSSRVSFLIYVSEIVQKYIFCHFVLNAARKLSLLKQIYALESSHYTLSQVDMVHGGLGHRSWHIGNQNIKKDADSAEI